MSQLTERSHSGTVRHGLYLSVAGASSWRTELVLALVLVAGAVEWAMTGRSESALYFTLLITPFAAGTGLLTRAREGRLDLAFAAGATRDTLYRAALLRAVGVPLACALAAAPLFFHSPSPAAVVVLTVRAAGAALFVGGIAFAVGTLEPRFLTAVAWLIAKLVLLLSGRGPEIFARMHQARQSGAPLPASGDTLLAAVILPEMFLLEGNPSLRWSAAAAACGGAAIAVCWWSFRRAEFAGKRSES